MEPDPSQSSIYVPFNYRKGLGNAETTKTGPNDVFGIVSRIHKFFIYLFHVLFLLTSVFRHYVSTGRQRPWKQAQMTPNASFGPLVCFSLFHSCFIDTTNYQSITAATAAVAMAAAPGSHHHPTFFSLVYLFLMLKQKKKLSVHFCLFNFPTFQLFASFCTFGLMRQEMVRSF